MEGAAHHITRIAFVAKIRNILALFFDEEHLLIQENVVQEDHKYPAEFEGFSLTPDRGFAVILYVTAIRSGRKLNDYDAVSTHGLILDSLDYSTRQ